MNTNYDLIKKIYFIGIGGIGMSALARYFNENGKFVCGYDRSETELCRKLQKEGIEINYTDEVDSINPEFINNSTDILIIYTPAIPSDNQILSFFRKNDFQIKKRAEVLGEITAKYLCLAIAGTHGKTTISSMIACILRNSQYNCTAFLGGIVKHLDTNYFSTNNKKDRIVVVEADEYDKSFLQLSPAFTIITSMDADHLDIYGDKETMEKTFHEFIARNRKGGTILVKEDLQFEVHGSILNLSYSLDSLSANYKAYDIRCEQGVYTFNVSTPFGPVSNIQMNMPGLVNVENAVAAIAMADLMNIKHDIIRKSMLEFTGIKRRFEYHIKTEKLVYIDDYAHHPNEIIKVVNSINKLHYRKSVLGIFQPHLFSRTRDFALEFARSLERLDEVILLDIYPAREKPIPNITSDIIFNKIKNENKILLKKNELCEYLKTCNHDVYLTIGAGDIDKLISEIKDILLRKA